LKLKRDNVDLTSNVLTVSATKFHKSRIVPIHESVGYALRDYALFRDSYRNKPCSDRFFLSEYGKALLTSIVHSTFQKLRTTLELGGYTGRLPRLYDFRHTFVCRRIQRWYEDGVDVNNAILNLSVYLGHVKPSDTYWYLSGIPDLQGIGQEPRAEAMRRAEVITVK
jgi:integrase